MNQFRVSSVPLAIAMLSAHTASFACSRTDFADSNLLGNNYIGDGSEDGGGDSAQQDQGANTAPQAGTNDVKTADSSPAAGSEQQAEGAAPQANAESVDEAKTAVGDPPAGQQT